MGNNDSPEQMLHPWPAGPLPVDRISISRLVRQTIIGHSYGITPFPFPCWSGCARSGKESGYSQQRNKTMVKICWRRITQLSKPTKSTKYYTTSTTRPTTSLSQKNNNQLAFLDVLLTRTSDGSLQTQVYRKNTHTDQTLSYEINHPIQHKIRCIQSPFSRIESHCNTQQTKQDELTYFHRTFKKNYPRNFINKFRIPRKRKMTNTTQIPDQEKQQKKRTALPYIRTLSEITARLFRQHHIEIDKPSHKLATNFTKHKDPISISDRRNIIYMFHCRNCDK